jgi:hypothetical protein
MPVPEDGREYSLVLVDSVVGFPFLSCSMMIFMDVGCPPPAALYRTTARSGGATVHPSELQIKGAHIYLCRRRVKLRRRAQARPQFIGTRDDS